VVWFFQRDQERIRVETRFDQKTNHYVMAVRWANGAREIERFATADTFRDRLEALERQLKADRWTPRGPAVLRDGWRLT
jgi:hypothetical protein